MLKITIIDAGNERRVVVEGKLVAPWVNELKAVYTRAAAQLGDRELVIDVRSLSVISQEGENLLLELMSKGIRFRCRGVFSKQVFRELGRRFRRELEGTLNELHRQNALG